MEPGTLGSKGRDLTTAPAPPQTQFGGALYYWWIIIITLSGSVAHVTFQNKTIEFMFAGIKMFWARLRLILARAARRGSKSVLRGAENIFMPKNIKSITIIITLEGIEEINAEKMTTKHSEEYFFHQRCE